MMLHSMVFFLCTMGVIFTITLLGWIIYEVLKGGDEHDL